MHRMPPALPLRSLAHSLTIFLSHTRTYTRCSKGASVHGDTWWRRPQGCLFPRVLWDRTSADVPSQIGRLVLTLSPLFEIGLVVTLETSDARTFGIIKDSETLRVSQNISLGDAFSPKTRRPIWYQTLKSDFNSSLIWNRGDVRNEKKLKKVEGNRLAEICRASSPTPVARGGSEAEEHPIVARTVAGRFAQKSH